MVEGRAYLEVAKRLWPDLDPDATVVLTTQQERLCYPVWRPHVLSWNDQRRELDWDMRSARPLMTTEGYAMEWHPDTNVLIVREQEGQCAG